MSRMAEPDIAGDAIAEGQTLKETICIIRSRLNVIGTTMYLLEESLLFANAAQLRYIDKMKLEMEVVRCLINR